jgi:hypothetical protein
MSNSQRTELLPNRVAIEISGEGLALTIPGGTAALSLDEALVLARGLTDFVAKNAETEGDDDEMRGIRLPMQYLVLAVSRDPDADQEEDLPDNGEVHCWIKEQTVENALHVAIGCINESEWIVTEVLDQRPVSSEDFPDEEMRQYYDQATVDEEVFLFMIGVEDAEGE